MQAGIPLPTATTNEKTNGHAIICDECLDLCNEIITDEERL